MQDTRISTRYAKSLLDLALERGELETVYADIQQLLETINENHDFYVLLKSPIVNAQKKEQILHAIFEESFTKTTMAFVDIITDKKREQHLKTIAASFVSQYRRHKDIVTATVVSAVSLEKEVKEHIHKIVQQATDSAGVNMIEKVQPDLIGGFILRVGDKQVDASVKSRLSEMKKSIISRAYIKGF